MDFRAAKIVLAVFLLIAFAIPFVRVSRPLPHPGENDAVRNAMYSAPVTANPSMAFTRLTALSDSTSQHVCTIDLTGK